MPFEKGNQLAVNGKRVQTLLERLVTQDNAVQLRKGLEKVLEMFADGDRWAIEYVTDRLDGKATQTTNVNISRIAKELTESELLAIASGAGTVIEAGSEEEPDQLH